MALILEFSKKKKKKKKKKNLLVTLIIDHCHHFTDNIFNHLSRKEISLALS